MRLYKDPSYPLFYLPSVPLNDVGNMPCERWCSWGFIVLLLPTKSAFVGVPPPAMEQGKLWEPNVPEIQISCREISVTRATSAAFEKCCVSLWKGDLFFSQHRIFCRNNLYFDYSATCVLMCLFSELFLACWLLSCVLCRQKVFFFVVVCLTTLFCFCDE